jgi:hypothetical protein
VQNEKWAQPGRRGQSDFSSVLPAELQASSAVTPAVLQHPQGTGHRWHQEAGCQEGRARSLGGFGSGQVEMWTGMAGAGRDADECVCTRRGHVCACSTPHTTSVTRGEGWCPAGRQVLRGLQGGY